MWCFFVVLLDHSYSNINDSNSVFGVFISISRTFICSCRSNIKELHTNNSYLVTFISAYILLWRNWIYCKCFDYPVSLPSDISLNYPNSYFKGIDYSWALSFILMHFWKSNSMEAIFYCESRHYCIFSDRLYLDILICWNIWMFANSPEFWGLSPILMELSMYFSMSFFEFPPTMKKERLQEPPHATQHWCWWERFDWK